MVEEEPLTKKQHASISESLAELNSISRDLVDGVRKTNSNIDLSLELQQKMQRYTIAAVKNLERIENENVKETKRRILWQTIAITHFVVDVFIGVIFITMLYVAR